MLSILSKKSGFAPGRKSMGVIMQIRRQRQGVLDTALGKAYMMRKDIL